MAITLSDLRTYASEIASPDISGSTADREINSWINSAVRRVYAASGWDRILHQAKLTILPAETRTGMGVTAGSTAVTLSGVGSETFPTKWADDRWELHIDGEDKEVFELASRASTTAATLRDGDEWTGSTATKSLKVVKCIYPLEDTAKQVERVQNLENGLDLLVLAPHEFDLEKSWNPTEYAEPRFATFRKGNLEIYPHHGSTTEYRKIAISYRKGPPVYSTADAGATTVDWDEEWKDLLEKAICLEASITQSENSPIPYPIAEREYEKCLARYQGLNANKDPVTGPMGLAMPNGRAFYGWPSRSRNAEIVDA
jgi:hypothetical protein